MANSASDARGSELEIRRKLIEDRCVDVIIRRRYEHVLTVTLPVTLWFLDRGKKITDRADQVLFIDAREIYKQIDRAHRDWTPQQIEFLANIVRLWRGEEPEFDAGSEEMLNAVLPDKTYADLAGLCGVATLEQIREQGWSLNPGRYVGVSAVNPHSDIERLPELAVEFDRLSEEAAVLTSQVRRLLQEISVD